jgi:hypothetical protein
MPNFMKIRQVAAEFFRADRRKTDKHDEVVSRIL